MSTPEVVPVTDERFSKRDRDWSLAHGVTEVMVGQEPTLSQWTSQQAYEPGERVVVPQGFSANLPAGEYIFEQDGAHLVARPVKD